MLRTFVVLTALTVAMSSCQEAPVEPQTPPPLPPTASISISPVRATLGSPDLTLTITGAGFAAPPRHFHSQAVWAANEDTTYLATTFVSGGVLTAVVPAALLRAQDTAQVFVLTGDPMGDVPLTQTAAARFFVVDVVDPISVSPASVVAGSPDVRLTLHGARFSDSGDSVSRVVWGVGAGDTIPLATTFGSSTQLTAVVPAALLKVAVTARVLVQTGVLGGGSPLRNSSAVPFRVLPPPPPPLGFSPASAEAGSPPITLTITGSGFRPGRIFYTQALWVVGTDTTRLATTFVNPDELTAVVPARLLTVQGTAQVNLESGDHIEGLLQSFPIGTFTIR